MRVTLRHLTLLIVTAESAAAQGAGTCIEGSVLDTDGAPVEHANVFLLETLDGDLTGADGRFVFCSGADGAVTLVVLKDGFDERRTPLTLPMSEPLTLRVTRAAIPLEPIVVRAGRLTAGGDPRLELNSLQVVTTPGAAADVYRAIRTFPGLQGVGEGAGLFVRGGDVFETRVFLDDAVVLSPYRYESPTGGFFGAFDPFQLDGIHFSTGGFGASYGDALSGIAALSTLGRPDQWGGGVTASLASVSATGELPLPAGLGVRATATRSSTDLLFRINGTTSEFTKPPEGRDLSGGVVWGYRPTGEVRVFGLDQRSRLGLVVEDPSYTGEFGAEEHHDLAVASWRDRVGPLDAALTIATAGATSTSTFGAFRLRTGERLRQARGRLGVKVRPWLMLTVGGDVERRRSRFDGEVPDHEHDEAPGAPTSPVRSAIAGTRHGLFAEGDVYITPDLRLTAGLRTDRATLARRRTWDPRLAAAYRITRHATLLAAWGVYHQVPAPYVYGRADGEAPSPAGGGSSTVAVGRDRSNASPSGAGEAVPPPMRAMHSVAGFQLGGSDVLLRIEAYLKRYRDLARQDRDGATVTGGRGVSRGVDVFLSWPEWHGWSGRVSWSWLHATRTDPNTRTLARSPFDVTHTWALVVDRRHGEAWQFGASALYATGRPFTPVAAASPAVRRDVWVPEYGAPYSERLPAFHRVDLAGSRLIPLGGDRLLVLFVAVHNALDRVNAYDIAYSADYAERRFVRSQFKRSVYFGATLDF